MSYTPLKKKAARRRSATSNSRVNGSHNSSGNGNAPRKADLQVTRSSGNVFLDIGFPPREAYNLHLRSQLMARIEQVIKTRGLTQSQAAKLFGVTQPRISDLVRGRINLFSLDMLVKMLANARMMVKVDVECLA